MKKIIIFISIAVAQIAAQAGIAKNFKCASTSTQQKWVNIDVNEQRQLISLQDLALFTNSETQPTQNIVDVSASVKTDQYGTQSVLFRDAKSMLFFININFKENIHFITVYDREFRQYTQIIDLKCE